MAVSTGVITNLAAEKWAQNLVNGTAMSAPTTFKFGEGGWQTSGSVQEARTPDETLTDLDAIENPGRYAVDERYTFSKAFAVGWVTYDAVARTCKCRCFLDYAEANNDGSGNDPEFWELGVFDGDGDMIGYVTFQKETKNALKQLEHYVVFKLGGA